MSSLSRRKGHNFERETAKELRPIFPEAKRFYQNRSGQEGGDVEGTPFWVECKRHRTVNIEKAAKQAIADRKDESDPILVVTKSDHGPKLATVEWDYIIHLLKALYGVK